MRLTFVTWNIEDGKRLDRVISYLKGVAPDIIQLQESGTSGKGQREGADNLHERLQRAFGLPGVYQRMFWAERQGGIFDIGLSTLSRYTILDQVTYGYEAPPTDRVMPIVKGRFGYPRQILGLQLALGKQAHWFFNTHMTVTPDAAVTPGQLESAHRVKRFLAAYDAYVLSGDMNTPYNSETYRVLAEGLRDVSKPELPTLHPTIHPVGHLRYHVDYVFLKGTKMMAEKSEVPVVDASDHLPVVVTLRQNESGA